jgi:threonine/homoserine/homoserine lactone efflux protein
MDFASAILLLALGFAVGLSGALMPGPLLVYTIHESLKKGKWTGVLVILGHAIVEVFIFIVLMLGLSELISSKAFTTAVSIIGGIMMILMGINYLRNLKTEVKLKPKDYGHSAIVGGIIFTAFNPGFPIWWATAGTRLLLDGFQRMGIPGMLLVFIGHWGADWGWFTFVSLVTSKSSRFLFEKGWYAKVRITLSIILLAVGAYFITTVF